MPAEHSNKHLEGLVRVRVKGTEIFWGKGVMDLLDYIKQYHSLKQACSQMQLSYSKGRRIIKTAEKELGFDLVNSEKGGAAGGSSVLTPEGEKFAGCYKKYAQDIEDYGESIFNKYFVDYL